MKFKTVKSRLMEGLHRVQNVVSSRSTLPILSNVLLNADKGKVTLTTTDLDVTVSCGVEAEVARSGTTTLPVKRLSSVVRELQENDVTVTVDEKDAATMECGTSFFKIIGQSKDEFPPIPRMGEGAYTYHISQRTFREMLRKTAYGASTDETRHVLNGLLLSFKSSKLTMVATDGRRLALVENETEFPKEAERDLIVPNKAVNELMHVLGEKDGNMKIVAQENQIMFEFDDVFMASKLIEGTYPNFRQVIPAQCEEHIVVEREMLLSALKRVSVLLVDSANATKLTFSKNKLVISIISPDVGEARETLPIRYGGKDITVAFNADYMIDPLKNLDCDDVFIELVDDLSPGVIKCDVPFLYVLMPMRVG